MMRALCGADVFLLNPPVQCCRASGYSSNGSACRSGKSVVTSYALNGWHFQSTPPDAKAFISGQKSERAMHPASLKSFKNDEPDSKRRARYCSDSGRKWSTGRI
ncbi:hypothetical protein KCP75_17920 [Salmonella enterica subsp. enterica]|nr:hypothetical protein KCP75_17920 [Salmonella enterica subsp. enterica]